MKALAVAALLLAAACSDASGPDGAARMRTDASVYLLRGGEPEVAVRFTVRNTTPGPITLVACSGGVDTEVQRRDANEWVPWTTNAGCPPSLDPTPQIVLAPGETAAGQVMLDKVGRYRLHTYVRLAESAQFSESAYSPDFEVRS